MMLTERLAVHLVERYQINFKKKQVIQQMVMWLLMNLSDVFLRPACLQLLDPHLASVI